MPMLRKIPAIASQVFRAEQLTTSPVTAHPSETSSQTTLTTLPSTWSTGKVYNEGPLSAYGAGYA